MADLVERLIKAVVEALPTDPAEAEPETLLSWRVEHVSDEARVGDVNLPPWYTIPEFGPAQIVAAKAVAAVLKVLVADTRSGLSPVRRGEYASLVLELEHRQLLMEEAHDA
jgi:hypothetical protein